MGYIGKELTKGAFKLITLGASFNGSTTAFTMSEAVGNANNLIVILGGVVQHWGEAYTVSGTTITFSSAPAASTTIKILKLGDTYDMGQAGSLKPEAVSGLTNITSLADADEFLVHDATDNQLKAVVKSSMPSGDIVKVYETNITSATASVTFDVSSADYKHWRFIFNELEPATDSAFLFFQDDRGNSAGTFQTSGYYNFWHGYHSGGGTSSSNETNDTGVRVVNYTESGGANQEGAGYVDLFHPRSAYGYSQVLFHSWQHSSGQNPSAIYGGGARMSDYTDLVNQVRFIFSSGNIARGNFLAYGYK